MLPVVSGIRHPYHDDYTVIRLRGHEGDDNELIVTRPIVWIDVDLKWARAEDKYWRLGRRWNEF